MIIEQSVEIPENHHIQVSFDIPYTVPAGQQVKVALSLDLPLEGTHRKGDWRRLCGKYKGSRTVADFIEDRIWDNLIEEVRMADRNDREIPQQVLDMAKRQGFTIEELRKGTYR
ncbi:hypothetical protein ACYULU_01490 [Breznakiellaceae bacterium SP9]